MAGPKGQSPHSWSAAKKVKSMRQELGARFSRFSMAEFEAQRHVGDMVQLLVGLAKDPTIDAAVRRQCAIDVIERADGKVAVKVQMQQVQVDESGRTLELEAEQAKAESDALMEVERWMSSGSSPEFWPEHIQARVRRDTPEIEGTAEAVEGEAQNLSGSALRDP